MTALTGIRRARIGRHCIDPSLGLRLDLEISCYKMPPESILVVPKEFHDCFFARSLETI